MHHDVKLLCGNQCFKPSNHGITEDNHHLKTYRYRNDSIYYCWLNAVNIPRVPIENLQEIRRWTIHFQTSDTYTIALCLHPAGVIATCLTFSFGIRINELFRQHLSFNKNSWLTKPATICALWNKSQSVTAKWIELGNKNGKLTRRHKAHQREECERAKCLHGGSCASDLPDGLLRVTCADFPFYAADIAAALFKEEAADCTPHFLPL